MFGKGGGTGPALRLRTYLFNEKDNTVVPGIFAWMPVWLHTICLHKRLGR